MNLLVVDPGFVGNLLALLGAVTGLFHGLGRQRGG